MAMYQLKTNHAETVDAIQCAHAMKMTGPGPFGVEYPTVAQAVDWLIWNEDEAETYYLNNEVFTSLYEVVP